MTGEAVPDFDQAHCDALARFVESLRRVNDASVSVRGSVQELDALTARTDALHDAIRARAEGKPLERFVHDEVFEGPLNHLLPYSPVTGVYHPFSPPVRVTREGDRLIGRVRFGEAYEGPPRCVHGGIISAVYDQLLAMVNQVQGLGGYTASLTVHYRKPTPLHEDTVWTCWTESVDGRKVRARGTCHAAGALVTEAEGLFIRVTSAAQTFEVSRGP